MAIQLNAIDIHKYLVLSVYYSYKHASFPVFSLVRKDSYILVWYTFLAWGDLNSTPRIYTLKRKVECGSWRL